MLELAEVSLGFLDFLLSSEQAGPFDGPRRPHFWRPWRMSWGRSAAVPPSGVSGEPVQPVPLS